MKNYADLNEEEKQAIDTAHANGTLDVYVPCLKKWSVVGRGEKLHPFRTFRDRTTLNRGVTP